MCISLVINTLQYDARYTQRQTLKSFSQQQCHKRQKDKFILNYLASFM